MDKIPGHQESPNWELGPLNEEDGSSRDGFVVPDARRHQELRGAGTRQEEKRPRGQLASPGCPCETWALESLHAFTGIRGPEIDYRHILFHL